MKIYFSARRLNICVLQDKSASDTPFSTQEIVNEGVARGHNVKWIEPNKITITTTAGQIFLQDSSGQIDVNQVDVLIPRIDSIADPTQNYPAFLITEAFERLGIPTLNSRQSFEIANDKLRTHLALTTAGIPNVTSIFAFLLQDAKAKIQNLLALSNNAQIIEKTVEGSIGNGVQKLPLDKISEGPRERPSFLQPFLKEAKCTDKRLYVVLRPDGRLKVVGAMHRKARDGEFRANASLGGIASKYRPTQKEIEMAIKATHAVGAKVAGIDLIDTVGGPEVLEVNTTPGFQYYLTTMGTNLAKFYIDAVESIAKK